MSTLARIYAASLCAAGFGLLTGCADLFDEDASRETEKPGLYDVEFIGGDINGEIGHPLSVSSARGRCVPDQKSWTASSHIISGSLPPGLNINDHNSGISGIPTERGHWIVKQELYNSECSGMSMNDHVRDLRFHITGSGKVVQ
jgi:hypothetical protein